MYFFDCKIYSMKHFCIAVFRKYLSHLQFQSHLKHNACNFIYRGKICCFALLSSINLDMSSAYVSFVFNILALPTHLAHKYSSSDLQNNCAFLYFILILIINGVREYIISNMLWCWLFRIKYLNRQYLRKYSETKFVR